MGMVLVPSLMFCQTFNQSDANGMKQGKWTKNYSNGTPRYEGQFKNNHPYGEFKYYYESGALKAITRFSTDGIVAHTKTFHENKQPMAEGKYIKQKKIVFGCFTAMLTVSSYLRKHIRKVCLTA